MSALSVAVMTAGLAAFGTAEARQTGPVACADLGSVGVANTTITTAERVAAGGFEAPGATAGPFAARFSELPAFCRVVGSIEPTPDSDIRFELWLPTADNWNGRFMQTGNGGAAGSIVHFSLVDPLVRGYAVANTDTGHQGRGGDFAWAVGHPERLVDYQYRAVHELTVVGKALTDAHYGKAHDKAYWLGCSTGGRQGLKEAQRYPDDYDAVVAGAPASNWSPLMGLSIHIQNHLGTDGLAIDKLRLLTEGAIAACDADDGVVDRVIASPESCGFDPASVQCASGSGDPCLSPTEVEAASRIYAGVVSDSGDVLFPGTGPGSERQWAAYISPGFRIGSSYFQNVVVKDPEWDPATFDADADIARADAQDAGAADAMDPDLSGFVARGGKLLVYHGTTDGLIPYGNSVNYHESVVAELGEDAIEHSVKLYLVPGMNHCAGGNGAHQVDWLGALERWVEDGVTPGALTAVHPAESVRVPGAAPTPSEPFTRVVCPYPEVARYTGSGDETDAANFRCVAP